MNNGIIVKKFNKHTSSVIGIKAIKDKNNNQYFVVMDVIIIYIYGV